MRLIAECIWIAICIAATFDVMQQMISSVSLVVEDYDDAIRFYVGKLGFNLLEDVRLSEEKRWVRVAPPSSPPGSCALLLAKADDQEQRRAIGHQTGGRVFLFLQTDDFDRDYFRFKLAGVNFCEEPRDEQYGRVVVFEDLYGNRWDLIEPKGSAHN